MKILIVSAAMLLLQQTNGCDRSQGSTTPAPAKPTSYQRFVSVPAPQNGMMGVPWTGYFALDTKTGQLCLTSDKHIPENFSDLPTCVVVTMTNPDAK